MWSRRFGLSLILGLSLLAAACPGQTPAPNPGGGRIIISGGAVQVGTRTISSAPITPDAFDSMVMSAASFDMDSPVVALGEFDPPVVAVGGRVVYRIVASALDESLSVPDTLPTPRGLELRAGGRGQTYMSSGGMKLRPQTTVIYRGTVTNTGTFTMPAFDVMAYGKPVKVPAASLTVVAAGAVSEGEPPRLLLELPEGDCYVGQLLKVGVLLPIQPNGAVQGLAQPHITGDFIFSEQYSSGLRQEMRQRDGKMFSTFLQEVLITPLRAGEQELIGQAHSYVLGRGGSVLVDSEPVTLSVKPLPKEGVLPGFTGAVGSFQIEPPMLSASEVRAGEPLTLTLLIRGEGNLGRLTPPLVPQLREWQSFPAAMDMTPAAAVQQRGFASFKYTLIPLRDTITATPAIPFSYFDPQKKAYVDLTIPPAPIKVNPGAVATTAPLEPPQAPAPDPEFDDPNSHEKEPVLSGLAVTLGAKTGALTPLQQRWWFAVLQILPAAALGGLWGWDRRRRFLEQHPEVLLKQRARRGLRRQLRLARRAASARDAAGFVAAGTDALREACAPHSAANPGALVCADVLQELPVVERAGRSGEMIRRFFATADALRFGGPVKDSSELLALQADLEQVLETMRTRL